MKTTVKLIMLAAVVLIMLSGCNSEPAACYDQNLVGAWITPSGSSIYTFAEDNSFEYESKSTSGVVITTTTYTGSWSVTDTNTLVMNFDASSKSDVSKLYDFVDGTDALSTLADSSDAYTNAVRWASEGDFTADDDLLLFATPDYYADSGWGDVFKKR